MIALKEKNSFCFIQMYNCASDLESSLSVLESPNRINWAVVRNGQMRANLIEGIYLELNKWNILM